MRYTINNYRVAAFARHIRTDPKRYVDSDKRRVDNRFQTTGLPPPPYGVSTHCAARDIGGSNEHA